MAEIWQKSQSICPYVIFNIRPVLFLNAYKSIRISDILSPVQLSFPIKRSYHAYTSGISKALLKYSLSDMYSPHLIHFIIEFITLFPEALSPL